MGIKAISSQASGHSTKRSTGLQCTFKTLFRLSINKEDMIEDRKLSN